MAEELKMRVFHVLTLFALVTYTSGKDCLLHDKCSCGFDDGSGFVDLTSLGNTDNTPRFKDVLNSDDDIYYSYNPCGGFNEGQCQDAAACMSNDDKTENIVIGQPSRAMFKYDDDSGNVQVGYTAGTGVLQLTVVDLVCDPTACDPVFEALGSTGPSQYELSLTTVCACPGKCTASGPIDCSTGSSSGHLSGGTILIIAFVSWLVVYMIIGLVFTKFVKKETGSNLIPNKDLWMSLPGLIVTGFRFVINKILRREGSYTAM